MTHAIRIRVGEVSLSAELNDSPTAAAILAALPIQAAGNRWGDEFYFAIPVKQSQSSDARADVAVGELAYSAPGAAFCIFFGPTPVSDGDRPRAASPVNPIGRVTGDATALREVADGALFTIEEA